jgi:hypothetical protein
VALGLNQTGAAILAAFTALAVWLLAPQLESLNGERPWTTPVFAASAALILFVIGAVTVRTDADHPAGASLVYAVDADSATAWLTGYTWSGSARSWLVGALEKSVAGRADADPPPWLTKSFGIERIVPAPLAAEALAPPTATLLSDSTTDVRRVTLRIRPAPGTRTISMTTDSGVVLASAVDGRPVDTKRYRHPSARWTLEYVAPSDGGFTLALTLVPGARPTLGLLARRDGIPLLGMTIPTRPTGIVPKQSGDMTIVYKRVTL